MGKRKGKRLVYDNEMAEEPSDDSNSISSSNADDTEVEDAPAQIALPRLFIRLPAWFRPIQNPRNPSNRSNGAIFSRPLTVQGVRANPEQELVGAINETAGNDQDTLPPPVSNQISTDI